MKSIKSMPAIAGPSFRPLSSAPDAIKSSMQRSQSMNVNKPQERMRVMARRVPFMAFPGVGSQLGAFARSFSRANLYRAGSESRDSRSASQANILGSSSYGSIGDFQQPHHHHHVSTASSGSGAGAGLMGPSMGSAQHQQQPSPFDPREYSEGPLFGNVFEDDLESMQPGFTLALGMAVFTAVLASFQVGYNSGVLNVPQDTIMASLRLTTLEWSVAVAIFCIGGLLGSLGGGKTADRIGRKNFLIANNTLFIAGGLLEALAGSIGMLSMGRLLIGVGCGGATVVVPMYLGEIAPANLRGSLGTMNQFAQVVGILAANLLGKPLGSAHTWRYLLGLGLIPALLQIIMAATLLESPLWLLHQPGSKNRVYAEEVLAKLRGTDDVEFDIECMMASVNEEDEEDDEEHSRTGSDDGHGGGSGGGSNHGFHSLPPHPHHHAAVRSHASSGGSVGSNNGILPSGPSSWGEDGYSSRHASFDETAALSAAEALHRSCMAKSPPTASTAATAAGNNNANNNKSHSLWAPEYRRPLMIGFGLQLVQQFSGINAVFFYSTAFFTSAHMSDPWLGSVLASTVNVLATGLSIYLIERMGRRKLLLISTFGMMLSCMGLTFALQAMVSPESVGLSSGPIISSSSGAGVGGDASSGVVGPPTPPAWVGFMSVAMVLVFVSFFEVGLGPIPWLIGAEIFPNRIRTEAMGISSTLNWLSNFAVGLSFPSISLALGPFSFVPFGVILAIAFVFEYRFVPETQGKTLEEIQEEFSRHEEARDRRRSAGGDDGASSIAGDATPRGAGFSDFSDEEEAGMVGDADAEGDEGDEDEDDDQTLSVAILPPKSNGNAKAARSSFPSSQHSHSSPQHPSASPQSSGSSSGPDASTTPIPEEDEENNGGDATPSSASGASAPAPAVGAGAAAGGQQQQRPQHVSRPRRGSSSGADDPVTEDENETPTDESAGSSVLGQDENLI